MPAPRSRRRVAAEQQLERTPHTPSHERVRAGAAPPRPGAGAASRAHSTGGDGARRTSALARASAGSLSGEVERWSSVGGGGDARARGGGEGGEVEDGRADGDEQRAPVGGARRRRAGSSGGSSGGSDAGAAGPALGDGVDGLPGDEGDEATSRGESGGEKQRSDIADDGERETTSAWSSHTRNEHSSSMYGVDVQLAAAAAEDDEDAAPEEEAEAAHVAHALARWPQLIVRAQPLGALPRSCRTRRARAARAAPG